MKEKQAVSVPLRGLVVFNPVLKTSRHTRSFLPVCGAKYYRAFFSLRISCSRFSNRQNCFKFALYQQHNAHEFPLKYLTAEIY